MRYQYDLGAAYRNKQKARPYRSKRLQHWVNLSKEDMRSMLIALIGYDFGQEPEKRIPEIRLSRKTYTETIANLCNISQNDVVLDLGSGCGFGTYWLAQRAKFVHACDISPGYLEFAANECAELKNINFHRINSRDLSFLEDGSIDVVCSISVFIHLNLYDIYWYFKEFARILRPGGRAWIDIADSDSIDFLAQNGRYFLNHANEYAEKGIDSLPGLMNWNSATSVIKLAENFDLQNVYRGERGELMFTSSDACNSKLQGI